jgi:DNA-directed RNA polymerase specialized sigma24 family protein
VKSQQSDPKRAKFRTWLNRVAHNAILNALTRGKPDRGSGDSALLAVLNQHPAHTGPVTAGVSPGNVSLGGAASSHGISAGHVGRRAGGKDAGGTNAGAD